MTGVWTGGLLALGVAQAAAGLDTAVSVTGALSPADPRVAVGWRGRWASEVQVGLEGRLGLARGLYLDGWPVSSGTTAMVLGQLSLPLTHRGPVALDLRVEGGPTWLMAGEETPAGTRSQGVRLEISPLATVQLSPQTAGVLGWTSITGLQLQPGLAMDALGQAVVVGGVRTLSPDLQLAVRGETGGLYGYNGDGAKYLVRGGVSLRWAPGSAERWLNF